MYLIILTTLLGLFAFKIGDFVKPVLYAAYRTSSSERDLIAQKSELKATQSRLSMVDDFAKYSKLQRKLNSIEQDLGKLQSRRLQYNFGVRIFCSYGIRTLVGIILLFLSLYYRYIPLMYINEKFDLSPFSSIIAFPTGLYNSVSVPFWIATCTSVGRLIKLSY